MLVLLLPLYHELDQAKLGVNLQHNHGVDAMEVGVLLPSSIRAIK